MKENCYIAIAMNDIPGLEPSNREEEEKKHAIKKGDKLYVSFQPDNCFVIRLYGQQDETGNIPFRFTDILDVHENYEHAVSPEGNFRIVIPPGARLKQAMWQHGSEDHETKVSCLANLHGIYMENKVSCASTCMDIEYPRYLRAFSRFSNTKQNGDFEKAFEIIRELVFKYKPTYSF